jgi:hypothetical protein
MGRTQGFLSCGFRFWEAVAKVLHPKGREGKRDSTEQRRGMSDCKFLHIAIPRAAESVLTRRRFGKKLRYSSSKHSLTPSIPALTFHVWPPHSEA